MRLLGSTLLFSVLLQAMVRQNDITTKALANTAVVEVDLEKWLRESIVTNNKSFLFKYVFNLIIVFIYIFNDFNVLEVMLY